MATPPPIAVDLRATRRRIIRLNRYVETHLLQQNRFICRSCSACRRSKRPTDEFRTGTMGHVGKRFDLTMGGKPLRIVVVGQEAKDSKVSLQKRYEQVRNGSGRDRRYKTDGEHPSRNPHMRGTTSALRLIFGTGLGSDYEGEFVHPVAGRPFHIFDGFALLNRLLCYAGPEKGVQARPTPTMFDNCRTHFDATLNILEPTILILQGKKVSAATNKILTKGSDHGDHLYEGFHGDRRILVCHFSHPSAHGDLRWGDSLHAPYLETVKQTLSQAIRRL